MMWRGINAYGSVIGLLTGVLLMMVFIGTPVYGDTAPERKTLPPRAIAVSPAFTGVVVPQGGDVNIDLLVFNRGSQDENIELSLSGVPPEWKARIKSYDFGVTGVYVKSDDTKTLTLRVEPAGAAKPGDYPIDIQARTRDGTRVSRARVVVRVKEKKVDKEPEGVEIITSYPVLKGPTDGEFEFSVEIENDSDQDSVFNLAASGLKTGKSVSSRPMKTSISPVCD